MKKIILTAGMLATSLAMPLLQGLNTAYAEVKHVEAIYIEMQGEILVAKSDDPSDPLRLLQVYNRANQLMAQTNCSGTKCTLDLSSLAPGIYIAKAFSMNTHKSQTIYVN